MKKSFFLTGLLCSILLFNISCDKEKEIINNVETSSKILTITDSKNNSYVVLKLSCKDIDVLNKHSEENFILISNTEDLKEYNTKLDEDETENFSSYNYDLASAEAEAETIIKIEIIDKQINNPDKKYFIKTNFDELKSLPTDNTKCDWSASYSYFHSSWNKRRVIVKHEGGILELNNCNNHILIQLFHTNLSTPNRIREAVLYKRNDSRTYQTWNGEPVNLLIFTVRYKKGSRHNNYSWSFQ